VTDDEGQRRSCEPLVVRRVDEHAREPPPIVSKTDQSRVDVADDDLGTTTEPTRAQVLDEHACRRPAVLDADEIGRSPAHRLDSESSRPGEQVEDARALQTVATLQSTEQRLTNAVRRRTRRPSRHRAETAPA